MVIWGSRGQVKDAGSTEYRTCSNCHNTGWWHLVTIRRMFTLFFIPVFPLSSRTVLMCPTCNRGTRLTGPWLDGAKQLNAITQAWNGKTLSDEEYKQRRAAILLSMPGGTPAPAVTGGEGEPG